MRDNMRDNPSHTFFQVLGGNIPDQLSLGGFRWLEVALFGVLLLGGLTIASTNWRLASTHRTVAHPSMCAMRLIPGVPFDGAVGRAIAFVS